jgi:hypothetical protein
MRTSSNVENRRSPTIAVGLQLVCLSGVSVTALL